MDASVIISDFVICTWDTLILTLKSGICIRIFRQAVIASRMNQRPVGIISPLVSKSGMNSAGEIGPNFLEAKRISTSAPVSLSCRISMTGWKIIENPRKS